MRASILAAGAIVALLATPLAAQQPPPPLPSPTPAPADAAPPPPPPTPAPEASILPPGHPAVTPGPPPPRRPPADPAATIRLRDGDRTLDLRCTPRESARECAAVALELLGDLGRRDRGGRGSRDDDRGRERSRDRDRDGGDEGYYDNE